MCNLINGILLVACTLSIVASRSVENDGPAQFFRQNVAFGEDLYSSVQQGRAGKNLLVSPFSVQTAFAMVFFGATGETAEEIATGLKLVSNDRQTVASLTESVIESQLNNPIINIANKIYVTSDLKIKPSFKDVVTKSFFSDVENIDFTNTEESASVINSWVDTKTNHMIPQVVSSSDLEDIELLLVNTVHFKGEWQYKFEKVQKEKFYYAKDKSVETNMMSANAPFKVPYGGFDKFAAIQLPFKDSSFSMLIILPNSDEDIQQVEERIKTLSIAEFKQQMWSEKVNVQIPKFKAEFSTELSENLKQLGIKRAFNGAEAELFDIASKDDDVSTVIRPSTSRLVVSKVIHKTAIEVNELGAEAAAVTGVGGHHFNLPSLGPSEPIEFKADRSFIYSIMDKSAIYFVGRYTAEEKQ